MYCFWFFDFCFCYCLVELNFKYFLGCVFDGYDEMKFYSNFLDEGSFEVDIDFYIDSDEYSSVYGENIVFYYRGYKI